MTGGSATLPDELLLRVLELVMLRGDGRKRWGGAVRVVSRGWRALHDGACTWLHLRNGVTDEVMHALCGRLPALKTLMLDGVTSFDGGWTARGGWADRAHLPRARLLQCDGRGAAPARLNSSSSPELDDWVRGSCARGMSFGNVYDC